MTALPDRLAVVSPHLDDGVLSLGAFIAKASQSGTEVTLVTVFAGDPDSTKPAGGWDRRGGFATEGQAARARRAEDRAACAIVGARPVWLGNSEADYADMRDEAAIGSQVWEAVRDASALLLPGFPLSNPDHALVTRLVVECAGSAESIGLYAEQPYRYWVRQKQPRPTADAIAAVVPGPISWTHLGTRAHLRRKRRAIREYRSQVPLLGLDRGWPVRHDRMLTHELLAGGEAIAWLAKE